MSTKERIQELMKSQHVNQQAFADSLGISSATLSSILTGRTKVTLNTIMAIKEKFPNLNYSWLIDGTGPMFNDGSQEASSSAEASGQSASSASPSSESEEPFLDFGQTPAANGSAPTPRQVPGGMSQREERANSTTQKSEPYFRSQNPNIVTPKIINNIHHSVAEILIIYDDQTCETFVPKK